MLLDDPEGHFDSNRAEPVIVCQLYLRLQPELCLTAGMLDVYVLPRLFTREEVEPIAADTQNSLGVVSARPELRLTLFCKSSQSRSTCARVAKCR